MLALTFVLNQKPPPTERESLAIFALISSSVIMKKYRYMKEAINMNKTGILSRSIAFSSSWNGVVETSNTRAVTERIDLVVMARKKNRDFGPVKNREKETSRVNGKIIPTFLVITSRGILASTIKFNVIIA